MNELFNCIITCLSIILCLIILAMLILLILKIGEVI